MEDNLIRMVHGKLAHLGADKLDESIRRNYWFPGKKEKIGNLVRNCIRCIMYAAPVKTTVKTLASTKKLVPFDTIHLDHFRR